ncbi:MAG: hypothetical protein KatS3mg114_0170 [Planctomycetaceae bacterium]|nr:MAG: hypothetical protein KatS3mg114_0170 [Planctomycetaceae bacterium]
MSQTYCGLPRCSISPLAINATVGEQWADPKFDANSNMTTIPRPELNRPSWANLMTNQWAALTADQWVEMEVAPTFRATDDAWNRLVKLTDGGDSTTVQENQYDGRGSASSREPIPTARSAKRGTPTSPTSGKSWKNASALLRHPTDSSSGACGTSMTSFSATAASAAAR